MTMQTITIGQMNQIPQFKALDAAFARNPVDIYVARDLTYKEKLMAFDEAIKICTEYKKHLKSQGES